jgi:hypothetical protein
MSNLEYFNDKVIENVEKLLRDIPITRDEDSRLVALYYYYFQSKHIKGKTAEDLLKIMAAGELVSSDLITRTRRKLQEHNPELRGTKWKERHERQEGVKSDTRKTENFTLPKRLEKTINSNII